MQASVLSGCRWKTKDLEWLPAELFSSYEIMNGELIVSRKPHLRRAAVIGKLCSQVYPAVRALGGILLVEPGIVWSDEAEDNVAPDLAIMLPDRLHLATGRAACHIRRWADDHHATHSRCIGLRRGTTRLSQHTIQSLPKCWGAAPIKSGGLRGAALPRRPLPPPP
jgi:hypothetical protein